MPSTKQNTERRNSSGYFTQGKAEPNQRARKKRTMPHAPFRLKAKQAARNTGTTTNSTFKVHVAPLILKDHSAAFSKKSENDGVMPT